MDTEHTEMWPNKYTNNSMKALANYWKWIQITLIRNTVYIGDTNDVGKKNISTIQYMLRNFHKLK